MKVEQWLIFNRERRMWWNPERRGYTSNPAEAGRYTTEEVAEIVAQAHIGVDTTADGFCPEEVAFPADILSAATDAAYVNTNDRSHRECRELLWWGYLHQNGSVQLKRWFGDIRDYTEDCYDNEFVQLVVPPFKADTRERAMKFLTQEILKKGDKLWRR